VSAGGTHEAIDPVRFIGNASSGRMGVEIARAAALRGARVTLVAAHLDVPPPSSVDLRCVSTTGELATAMSELTADADVVVMAAAPADFTPRSASATKLKKSGDDGLTLELVQTTDVLAGLARSRRCGQTIVGFAAETLPDEAALATVGQAKLTRKGVDLLVVNDVSDHKVFGMPDNKVLIVDAAGVRDRVAASKAVVAHRILDAVLNHRASAN
jgi:phosphopantothenoylcysteine decarboxylase/phosphopantothenate--cysteine ligase